MWRFWGSVFARIPRIALRAAVLIEELIAAAIFVAWLIAGQNAASSAMGWFAGLHTGWVLMPMIVVFVHLISKAIYEEHTARLSVFRCDHEKKILELSRSAARRVEDARSWLLLHAESGFILAGNDITPLSRG